MPRAFTTAERERIRGLLLDIGERLFARHGIRRTQIDEITAEASIAKGSFYSFFPSKEELYLQVAERVERRIRDAIDREMVAAEAHPCDLVLWFLRRQARAVLEEPFIAASFTGEDLRYLRTRVEPKRFAEHMELDTSYLAGVLRQWRRRGITLAVDDDTAIELIRRAYLAPIALGDVAGLGDAVSDHAFCALAAYLTRTPCDGDNEMGGHDE